MKIFSEGTQRVGTAEIEGDHSDRVIPELLVQKNASESEKELSKKCPRCY
ncbi:MAG TPA: hypothetical protein VFD27_04085 [Chthoniobacteraceae bacterium]|nr:hypothetical protein [Chthoniobacteraceae bacterium]